MNINYSLILNSYSDVNNFKEMCFREVANFG